MRHTFLAMMTVAAVTALSVEKQMSQLTQNNVELAQTMTALKFDDDDPFSLPKFLYLNEVKQGDLIKIGNQICDVKSTTNVYSGKHGAHKVHVKGVDLFTHESCETLDSASVQIEQAFVTKIEYIVVGIDETTGNVDYINNETGDVENILLPTEAHL